MMEYIGLDVSMKETAVSIRRNGERVCAENARLTPSLSQS